MKPFSEGEPGSLGNIKRQEKKQVRKKKKKKIMKHCEKTSNTNMHYVDFSKQFVFFGNVQPQTTSVVGLVGELQVPTKKTTPPTPLVFGFSRV